MKMLVYDHYLANKVYLGDITVANIFRSFTHKMATKTSWRRYGSKLRHCHLMLLSVLWRCWLGGRKGIRPVKTERWGADGVVICL